MHHYLKFLQHRDSADRGVRLYNGIAYLCKQHQLKDIFLFLRVPVWMLGGN